MRTVGSLYSPVVIVGLLFGGLVAGQLARINPFANSGAAASLLDIGLAMSALVAIVSLVRRRHISAFVEEITAHRVWRWSLLFLVIAALSLGLRLGSYSAEAVAVAASYLARLGLIFFVGWFAWFRSETFRKPVMAGFRLAAAALIVFGFLQLLFVPDFRFAVDAGWDPHIGRLFSTFLDPNFFGIFAVLVMALSLATYLGRPQGNRRWLDLSLFFAAWGALFLAYSRSAWAVGLLAVPGVAWKRSPFLAVGLVVVFVGILFLPTRLGDRFQSTRGLVHTSDYVGGQRYRCSDDATRCDASGSGRVFSLREGLELALEQPVTGVGYNAYGFALEQRGDLFRRSLQGHSANGSDSSLLNVWATTGIFGLLAFLAFFTSVLRALWRRAAAQTPAAWTAWALCCFTAAWLLGSFLNNALLYPHLLVPWLLLVAVTIGATSRGRA